MSNLTLWSDTPRLLAKPLTPQLVMLNDGCAEALAKTRSIFHVVGGTHGDNALAAETLLVSLNLKASSVFSTDIYEPTFVSKRLTAHPVFDLSEENFNVAMGEFLSPLAEDGRAGAVLVQHGASSAFLMQERWLQTIAYAARKGVGVIGVFPISADTSTQVFAGRAIKSILSCHGGCLVLKLRQKRFLAGDPYDLWDKQPDRALFLQEAYGEIAMPLLPMDTRAACDVFRMSLTEIVRGEFSKASNPGAAAAFFGTPRRDDIVISMSDSVSEIRAQLSLIMRRMYRHDR